MIATLRKVLILTEGSRRGRWLLVSALAAVNGVLETVGAFLVLGLLGVMADPEGQVDLPFVGGLTDVFPGISRRDLLLTFSAIVAVFFVVRAVLFLVQTYVRSRIAHNAGVRLSVRLLETYLNLPYEEYVMRNSSDLIRNTFTSVAEVVAYVFVPATGLISEFLIVLGLVAALIIAAPVPSLLATVVLLPVVLLLLKVVQPRMRSLGEEAQESSAAALKALQEGLGGAREIRVFGVVNFFRNRFAEARAGLARTQYLRATYVEAPRNIIETSLILMIVLFLTITILRNEPTRDTLAILGLFGYAGLRILPSINRLVANFNSVRFGSAAVDDLTQDVSREVRREGSIGSASFDTIDELIVRNVSFRFGEGPMVLRDIEFSARAGETIGIVGQTGCGKSTLMDVLLGLLAPTAGTVTVDGVSIHDHTPSWLRHIGMVSQTVFLVDDTLRRNIAFGLPRPEIDDEHVTEVVRIAQLQDFVDSLPDGLETVVGERGIRLSGGQRQRIAIARALYRRPRVLFLDEATSALDTGTETRVVNALNESLDLSLTVMIAHRLSSLVHCDRILLIDQGAVVASGKADELTLESELFRRMTASHGSAT